MSIVKRVAQVCLRIPAICYDLSAIVLVSTGINVITGAGGNEHERVAFGSGLALGAAGALFALLKSKVERILRTLESSDDVKAEEIARKLEAKDHSTGGEGLEADYVASVSKGGGSSPIYNAIHTHLEVAPRDAVVVAVQCLLVVILLGLGVLGTFWSFYADENTDLRKTIASTAQCVQRKVEAESTCLANELAALSQSIGSNHVQAVKCREAHHREIVAELAKLRAKMAAISALMTSAASRASAPEGVKTEPTTEK